MVGGMLTATFLAIFFVPLFYVFVMRIFSRGKNKPSDPGDEKHLPVKAVNREGEVGHE